VAWRKGTSAGMFRPKESADRGRNPVPERGWPTVQKWHGAKNTDSRDKSKTIMHREPRQGGRSGWHVGLARNSTMA
jgi:hypothetical protein